MGFIKTAGIACAASLIAAGAAQAAEIAYSCSDGSGLTALFSPPAQSPGSVVLGIDGSPTPIELPQVVSADGGRYAGEDIQFWIKGNDATLTRQGGSVTCKTR